MKNIYLLFLSFFYSAGFSQQLPETKKIPNTITKYGISYQDDYKWLEKLGSEEVNKWVDTQNSVTNIELETAKKGFNLESKIKYYDYLSSNSLPSKKGKYFYSRYRKNKDFPSVLRYRKTLTDTPIEILDPYEITNNKNVLLSDYYPSKSSSYLAYTISGDGGDKQEIHFVAFDKSKVIGDILTDIKFSSVVWNKDSGIFYKKNNNHTTFAADSTYQLVYHRLGTTQMEDQLILDTTKKESNISFFTADDMLFVVEKSKDETRKSYYYCSLNDETFTLEKFISDDTSNLQVSTYRNGRIYFSSSKYGWGDVRSFDLKNRADETVIIPQIYTHLLLGTYFYDDYIICKYKKGGSYYLSVYDKDGKFIRKFDAPQNMDFDIRFFNSITKDLYITSYSYVISFQNLRLNIESGEVSNYYNEYIKPKATLFPLDHFETKTITYKSRDNEDIPITIVYKKGVTLDGRNPTLLKAYGGFGSVSGPSYDTGLLYFIENGGIFAFAEIRGGGEKGLPWHTDGMGLKKRNSINDFIDAAEFLIKEKYTSADKLAITGGSHGGLIVGAALIERPELFKVAVPIVGRFDVLTLEDYTSGKFHLDEYGNPNNKEEYRYMLGYSPYQNIKEEINYPVTLIITSENDDRVPPLQSYKFAARLQNRAVQKNPIYLKIEKNSGHYGNVSSYDSKIKSKADFYGFIMYQLGM